VKRLILTAVAGAAILAIPASASAIPVHVHEKVPVEREVVLHDVVRGDPLVAEAEVQVVGTKVEVIHVAPRDQDDDGLADREDDCIGFCEPAPVATYSSAPDYAAPASSAYADPAVSSAAPSVVQCESGGDYAANTGNGYYGGYQFDSGTWDAYGDPAYGEANEAPPAVQDAAAAAVPYDAWPSC
jgi:hypothetical protein